ncbi:MAG: HNH endonuclease [Planctomycetes bacterium]|nr:HNH endonuclease [Planctomycetota bacterium]
MTKRVNYRKLAFIQYDPLCAHCGFGVPAVLEVAHIDGNRSNNESANLVILCPNCHKMHDLDLISTETIIQMRDRPKVVKWSKRMKDAGQKAALTRLRRATLKKRGRRAAALKAAATRKQNAALAESNGEEGST